LLPSQIHKTLSYENWNKRKRNKRLGSEDQIRTLIGEELLKILERFQKKKFWKLKKF
jgi:hypothetical protein